MLSPVRVRKAGQLFGEIAVTRASTLKSRVVLRLFTLGSTLLPANTPQHTGLNYMMTNYYH